MSCHVISSQICNPNWVEIRISSKNIHPWVLVAHSDCPEESGAGSHSLTDNLTITIKIAGHPGHAKSRAKNFCALDFADIDIVSDPPAVRKLLNVEWIKWCCCFPDENWETQINCDCLKKKEWVQMLLKYLGRCFIILTASFLIGKGECCWIDICCWSWSTKKVNILNICLAF